MHKSSPLTNSNLCPGLDLQQPTSLSLLNVTSKIIPKQKHKQTSKGNFLIRKENRWVVDEDTNIANENKLKQDRQCLPTLELWKNFNVKGTKGNYEEKKKKKEKRVNKHCISGAFYCVVFVKDLPRSYCVNIKQTTIYFTGCFFLIDLSFLLQENESLNIF